AHSAMRSARRRGSAASARAGPTGGSAASAASTVRADSGWSDKGLRQPHRLCVGERLIELVERVGFRADRTPRDGGVVPLEDAQRADEMSDLTAPAAANFEVLAVDLLMHVH